ncbi:MAG: hypothetical protein GWN86_30750, partial [Desulfobacterales bacterium]|nr:hypothetical protein [Desulfobacterales bacterium]
MQKGEVKKREVVIDPGVIGYRVSIIDYLMRKVSKLIGALADGYAFHTIEFPNQQAGKLECAPTAVSNSLKFLN